MLKRTVTANTDCLIKRSRARANVTRPEWFLPSGAVLRSEGLWCGTPSARETPRCAAIPKRRTFYADALSRLVFNKPLQELTPAESAELDVLRAIDAEEG